MVVGPMTASYVLIKGPHMTRPRPSMRMSRDPVQHLMCFGPATLVLLQTNGHVAKHQGRKISLVHIQQF